MTTLDLAAPAAVRAARPGRSAAAAVGAVFYALGWVLMWLCPPFVVVAARLVATGVRWCFTAARLGWVEARDGRPVDAVATGP